LVQFAEVSVFGLMRSIVDCDDSFFLLSRAASGLTSFSFSFCWPGDLGSPPPSLSGRDPMRFGSITSPVSFLAGIAEGVPSEGPRGLHLGKPVPNGGLVGRFPLFHLELSFFFRLFLLPPLPTF